MEPGPLGLGPMDRAQWGRVDGFGLISRTQWATENEPGPMGRTQWRPIGRAHGPGPWAGPNQTEMKYKLKYLAL